MVPTFILLGLLIGLLPRPWLVVGLVVAAMVWPVGRVVSGERAFDIPNMAGEMALCAINLALGAVAGRLLFHTVRYIRG